MASTLGAHNPLRYRGYVYDTETGLYYLQSRYYDPEMGRFINADGYASTGQGILGTNMFAYCGNNPVKNIDQLGTSYESTGLSNSRFIMVSYGLLLGTGAAVALTLPSSTRKDKAKSEGVAIPDRYTSTKRQYTVYFLSDANSHNDDIVYVGRVKTENFDARMSYHESKGRAYNFSINNLTYAECRFVEQAGMIWCHSINRDNSINNQIRGISPNNPYLEYIMLAAIELMESGRVDEGIFPISYWANQTENMILNGSP